MWRNIFGHTFYQVLALIAICFFASKNSILVYDYEVACFKLNKDGSCKLFNPYYCTELYYTAADIDLWYARKNGKLFDKNLLASMNSEPVLDGPSEKLLHYTIIFQAFVVLQIVN